MKIIVCDDDPSELRLICKLLEDYFANYPESSFHIYRFSCALSLIDFIENHSVDLYILDILMPVINGIEVGEAIREKDTEAPIVYITLSPDFAVQSYAVHAMDYILKPIAEEAVHGLMERVIKHFRSKEGKTWLIKIKSGFYSVSYNEIMYIEYQGHRLYCHLADGSVVESSTMRMPFDEAVAELKADSHFLKIGASFLVHMRFVLKVTANEFIMRDGTNLTITRQYRDARKIYIDYLLIGDS